MSLSPFAALHSIRFRSIYFGWQYAVADRPIEFDTYRLRRIHDCHCHSIGNLLSALWPNAWKTSALCALYLCVHTRVRFLFENHIKCLHLLFMVVVDLVICCKRICLCVFSLFNHCFSVWSPIIITLLSLSLAVPKFRILSRLKNKIVRCAKILNEKN